MIEHYVTAMDATPRLGWVLVACRCGWMDSVSDVVVTQAWRAHLSEQVAKDEQRTETRRLGWPSNPDHG